MKDQLEALILQMYKSNILYSEGVREFKKRFILTVLQENKGNQCRAARELGMHRNTLSRTIDELKIDVRQLRDGAKRPPRSARPVSLDRDRKRKWCAKRVRIGNAPLVFLCPKKLRQPSRAAFLFESGRELLRGGFVNRLLGRGGRGGFQQLAFLHGHHERTWRIGGRFALEVQTGVFLGDQLQRNLVFEGERNIRLLGVNVIEAARDVKLRRRRLDDRTVSAAPACP